MKMTPSELEALIETIDKRRSESQTLEIKAAHKGCPEKLYGTLSSFSNQDDGGVIVFGLDEAQEFERVGVYDAHDLQRKVSEQCGQMQPPVRPLFTTFEQDGKVFMSAEIPAIDLSDRPCFYRGAGRLRGSYVRVGDMDMRMTEYEVYSYEAFRRNYQDDVRPVQRATLDVLDEYSLGAYLTLLKRDKAHLARQSDRQIYELMSIVREGHPTLAAVMLFSPYPQAYFPQLCITAVCVPGAEIGELGELNERFLDNQRIEGTIPEMLDGALKFVRANMRVQTILDPATGKRVDRTEYPVVAVREILLNALVHRDYSVHTETMPIQLILYADRLEVRNPGGLYGRLRVDQLGKVQPATRNPVLATALEVMKVTENRYSGIPTIRREMEEAGLPEPIFADERGSFVVTLKRKADPEDNIEKVCALVSFCESPRTRKEIAGFLGLKSVSYAIWTHVMPLVEAGLIRLTIPDRPGSPNQRFYAAVRAEKP